MSEGQHLRAAIESQPREVARLLADRQVHAVMDRIRDSRRLLLVGTGTSYHGAMVGQYMLRPAGREAWAMRAFDYACYPPRQDPGDGLVLLSHRGTKRYSQASLDAFRSRSSSWIAIVGEDAPVDGQGVVRTVVQERSPVHTVSHLGAMIRLAQLAALLREPGWRRELDRIPEAVAQAVADRQRAGAAVDAVNLQRTVHFVGGGPAHATALEGALKFREASYVPAEGHDLESVFHGPLVSIHAWDSVVLVAQPGPSLERTHQLAAALHAIGANVVAVGPEAASVRAKIAVVTPRTSEELAPIVNAVPLQWMAYEAAQRQLVDADSFRRIEPSYAEAQSQFLL
jgi:glucosamine--fructose-6-phosphate aminotransferase (isomerizing)